MSNLSRECFWCVPIATEISLFSPYPPCVISFLSGFYDNQLPEITIIEDILRRRGLLLTLETVLGEDPIAWLVFVLSVGGRVWPRLFNHQL